jgi:hypothetical protein
VLASRVRDESVESVQWMNVRGGMLKVVGKVRNEGLVKA